MELSTTTMLAILDGHGSPPERQEMRRRMQAAGVDAPLQRWRAVGERLELTLLNGKIIYLPDGGERQAATAGDAEPMPEPGAAGEPQPAPRSIPGRKPPAKRRQAGSHGLHP